MENVDTFARCISVYVLSAFSLITIYSNSDFVTFSYIIHSIKVAMILLLTYFTAAICSPSCLNRGTCVQPNVCQCASGWTGSQCGTGIIYLYCGNAYRGCMIIAIHMLKDTVCSIFISALYVIVHLCTVTDYICQCSYMYFVLSTWRNM